ncbi:hypothetical protein CCYA_CCYA10G2912 [Cyanidiococcus yangmingshanensis]|nr:hypothetical protein CCYA_CCYA10G2912 [Cyanidiococcus yangmingshanensis]
MSSIFVGGLNRDVTEESLRQVFGSFGVCRINLFPTYAFVDYDNPRDAEEAFHQVNSGGPSSTVNGLPLRVEWSKRSRKSYGPGDGASGEMASGAGPGSSGGCFECGSMDHRVRDCPVRQEKERLSGGSGRMGGGYGSEGRRPAEGYARSGGPGGRVCYNCGGVGHTSRECPSERGIRGSTGDRGAGDSSARGYSNGARGADTRSCYKCGESGHIARYCPSAQSGGTEGNTFAGRGRREPFRSDRRERSFGRREERYGQYRDTEKGSDAYSAGATLGRYPEHEGDRYDFGQDANGEHHQFDDNEYNATSADQYAERDSDADNGGHSEDNENDGAGMSAGYKRRYADEGSDGHGSHGHGDDDDDDGGAHRYADDDERGASDAEYGTYDSEGESTRMNGSRKRSRHDGDRDRGHDEHGHRDRDSDWNALTLKELKTEAEKHGIDTAGLRLKKDYVEALEKASA